MSYLSSLKQNTLVSGTNIKTINGNSLLGSGNLTISGGTVTSVGLTTGTSGTDLNVVSSPITGAGTITLNVPTASATNRGALSSADWSTFNTKQASSVSGTNIKTINGNSLLGSGDLTITATPPSGTVVLLNADETIGTGGTNATIKTYVLGSNTYSRIIIESECEFQQNTNLNASCNFCIYVGSTVKRIVECFASATGAGDYMRDGIAAKYSEAITAGATITIRTENTVNATFQVNSLRVYGVY